MSSATRQRQRHYVYLLRCGDRTYYIGWTVDPVRRLAAHRRGRGARYTRGRGPMRIVALWRVPTRSAALRLEHRLKRLPREFKRRLAAGIVPEGLAPLLPRHSVRRVAARTARRRSGAVTPR
ncbi:MAG TPA: GIY-YIG nuclease family protein [bacterium]|nr:GIY-YIG nuclease family protein [bacterium]